MYKLIKLAILSLMVILCFSSCSSAPKSPITFSIEELGAETATRNDDELGYRSAVAITGISVPYITGRQLSVPGKGLPDIVSTPISTSCSQIIETIYDTNASETDIKAIATALEELRTSLVNKAIAETKLSLIAAARIKYQEAKKNNTLETESLLKTYATALGMAQVDDNTLSAKEKELNDKITEESNNLHTHSNVIVGLNSKHGLYIFRWAKTSSSTTSTSVGAFFSGAKNRKDDKSGYLIVAGLRTSSLEIGDDLILKYSAETNGHSGSDAILKNSYITSFTLGAKFHYFSEDRNVASTISASLKLSKEELNKIFGGGYSAFLQAQSLAVEAAIANSVAVGARGSSTNRTVNVYPFRFWGDTAFAASGDAERIRAGSYTNFYSSRSSLTDSYIGRGINSSSNMQCAQMVPSSGPVRKVRTNLNNYQFLFCMPDGWDEGGEAKLISSPADWSPDLSYCVDFSKPMTKVDEIP